MLGIIGRQIDSLAARHGNDFPHDVAQEGARLRILPYQSDGFADRGRGARQAHQEYIFLPDLAPDVRAQLRSDTTFQAGFEKELSAFGSRSIELPEQEPLHRTRLPDHAGPIDRSGDISDAAHDARCAERVDEVPIFQYAVLKGDNRRVRVLRSA